ncbi:MAG: hypothetical protein ACP5EQ_03765 [Candidatus Cloacimonadia bacterium]
MILQFALCNLHFAMERSDRSLYWLKQVERTGLILGNESKALVDEANELTKIVAKSVITAKGDGR